MTEWFPGMKMTAGRLNDRNDPETFNNSVTVNGLLTSSISLVNGLLTVSPTPGAGAKHIQFNEGYSVYVDNAGAGAANNRMWIDCPNDGQVVIGPRAGASALADVRLRTDATVGSAANMFINSSSYQIFRSTSSMKYKQDVSDKQFDLAAIRALRPVQFHDKNEMATDPDNAVWYVGLIAEEVHALGLTEFVSYHEGEPDAVMYDRVCIGLLQVVKENEERLAALEAQVATLINALGPID